MIARLDGTRKRSEIVADPQPTSPGTPAMIKGIKFTAVPSRDQDRALAFWTEKMGFVVHTDQPFTPEQRWIELRIKGSDTHLVLFTTDADKDRVGQFQSISFYCDSVQATYDELVARGVEFKAPPKKEDWGTSAIFQDPDGNSFVLSSR
jgi:catechol 2,3-dioxygenase-like lactoylglutathione lyase family enzyme